MQNNTTADDEAARRAAEAEQKAAEAARQRALAEAQRKQAEADAQRQAAFEKARQDALNSMRGITENELGLKGVSTGGDLGLKGIGETKPDNLGLKGLGETPVVHPTAQMEETVAVSNLLSHSAADTKDKIAEFLFPVRSIFPKNPDKPLLNPLIEKAKVASLPSRGETVDDFVARFRKTDLFKQIEPLYNAEIKPWGTGKMYPRGTYPDVDSFVDETIARMSSEYVSGVRDACRKAVETMNAEWARMEQSGMIAHGEDLNQREKQDVLYENAMMSIRHRVYEQLGKDIGRVMTRDQVALDRLKERIPEMQRQNRETLPDLVKYLFPPDKP